MADAAPEYTRSYAMHTENNKALLRHLFESINKGDWMELDDHPGFWQTRQVVPPTRASFADWRTAYMQQIAEGDSVFSYLALQFTHAGAFGGVEPEGRRVTLAGFSLDRVDDGIVVEHNSTTTWPDVLRQIGAPSFQTWPPYAARPLAMWSRAYGTPTETKAIVARLLRSISRGDETAALRHDGIGVLVADFAAIRAAFPDLAYTLVHQISQGDLVGTRATLHGTHSGALYGLPPTGKTITWDYFSLTRVVEGAVVEHIGSADWTAALVHLGMFP